MNKRNWKLQGEDGKRLMMLKHPDIRRKNCRFVPCIAESNIKGSIIICTCTQCNFLCSKSHNVFARPVARSLLLHKMGCNTVQHSAASCLHLTCRDCLACTGRF